MTLETPTTVFQDPVDFTVKHPLEHKWTLFYDVPSKDKSISWLDNVKEIVTLESVEDFWGVYNHLQKASELPASANYHLFRAGVKPMWEDIANAKGGKWSLNVKPSPVELDSNWLDLLLAVLGEQFTYPDEICGAVVSIRKTLWTKTASDVAKTMKCGAEMKAMMHVSDKIGYVIHSESEKKKSSYTNEKYSI